MTLNWNQWSSMPHYDIATNYVMNNNIKHFLRLSKTETLTIILNKNYVS